MPRSTAAHSSYDFMEDIPASRHWERASRFAGGGSALASLALLGLAMSAIGLRASIVRIAPKAAVLFEAAGLPVNLAGLEIGSVVARLQGDADHRLLLVEGDVANFGEDHRIIPAMRVSIRSADRRQVYVWTTKPTQQKIAPGERAAFSARLASPPADAVDVVVEFDRPTYASPTATRNDARLAGRKRPQGSSTESQ